MTVKESVVGIDPGASKNNEGGMACISDGELAWVMPMPLLPEGKTKSVMDVRAIRNLIAAHAERVVIEKQQVMPKQGAVSGGKTMWGEGVLVGICEGLELPYEIVKPRRWQDEMLKDLPKGDTKAASIVAAQRLYPKMVFKRDPKQKAYHNGMTDAALIATYGCRQLNGVSNG